MSLTQGLWPSKSMALWASPPPVPPSATHQQHSTSVTHQQHSTIVTQQWLSVNITHSPAAFRRYRSLTNSLLPQQVHGFVSTPQPCSPQPPRRHIRTNSRQPLCLQHSRCIALSTCTCWARREAGAACANKWAAYARKCAMGRSANKQASAQAKRSEGTTTPCWRASQHIIGRGCNSAMQACELLYSLRAQRGCASPRARDLASRLSPGRVQQ